MASSLFLIFSLLITVSPSSLFAYRITRDVSHDSNLVEEETIKSTLRLVNLVIRHGERSPQSTYPNDPYRNDSFEPFGWGQLTNNGRLNQYNQGLFLRKRYGEFLGTKYNPEIFWLQSTASDRTKMSALIEAAALWQPDNDQTFLNGLSWQPTSLNYQTSDKDDLLLIWSTCPDYARMREIVLKSPEIKEINEINKDLYNTLTNYSGQHINNPDDVFDLYGTLLAEQTMNLELPSWTNEYFPEMMESLSSLSLKINVYNETLLKMKAAPLITKITNSMVEKAQGTLKPDQRKMYMYVGHDSTIVNLLEGMKVWDMQIPYYGIMTIIELHQDELGYNVQLYLRNSTEHNVYPLTVPGCTFACPVDEFISLLSKLILTEDEWKQECLLKDPNYVPGNEPLP